MSLNTAALEFESILNRAVRQQIISDVPLGAFLSGGVDSSTLVALMQAQSSRPVRTFTIGFQDSGFDEAPYARKIAEHLGTEHTETYVGWERALELIPRLPEIYDEPFADSSQIPTYLVSSVTRRHVMVSIPGTEGMSSWRDMSVTGWAECWRAPSRSFLGG